MEVLHARCAALDVHKKTVVACARCVQGREVQHHVRTFGTTTKELLALCEWLEEHGCTHVAMEATGVYWKPVWHVLEGHFELVLGNANHLKNVPGRKTDKNDAMWLADLMAHGLIRSSLVPAEPIQQLRDLTRTRKQLVRESSQHVQRIQKVLEDANIKLDNVISDLVGLTGRAILRALIGGEKDPQKLASLGHKQLKCSREELAEALHGTVTDHHRLLLRLHLHTYEQLQQSIGELEEHIEQHMRPFREQVELLKTIPGIRDATAHVLAAEIGLDMSRVPTDAHLRSWAGLCPRNDESAGKRRSTRIRHGAPWLKTTLVQAAWAATRSKNTYFNARYHRIRGRRGHKKAVVAVAASMLTSAYHVLRTGTPYRELGRDHYDRRDAAKTTAHLLRRLHDLGVDVQPVAATSAT
jgi:transposase